MFCSRRQRSSREVFMKHEGIITSPSMDRYRVNCPTYCAIVANVSQGIIISIS
jgi:hypothetical protein